MVQLHFVAFVFVSLAALGFSAPNAGKRTVVDIVGDLAVVSARLTSYNDTIHTFPVANGTAAQVLDIHSNATAVEAALNKTRTDLVINGALGDADGNVILNLVQQFEPKIIDSLDGLLVRKLSFLAFPDVAVAALMRQDIVDLNATVTAFEDALIFELPADLQDQARMIEGVNDAAFTEAINAYTPA